MFERMTDAVRRVIVSAQAEVASMRHAEIDDDHLLLALTMGNDPAAELVASRVTVAALHRHVARAHDRIEGTPDYVPMSLHAKRVLEESLRQALRLGRDHIDTFAVLFALLEVRGNAAGVLLALGVDLEELAREAQRAADATAGPADEEEAVAFEVAQPWTVAGSAVAEEPRTLRPWPSPRCHGCRRLIRDHMQLRTLTVIDETTGEPEQFRFLYCGACGTAFAIERVKN